jgi:translation initiation factor IF-3
MVHQINEDIRDREVRLIGGDGEQLGIMPSREALKIAQNRDLDLVKIAPTANPPVCRIMDYGKFRFEQSKREKEAKKHQHIVEVKEIRLSPGIDIHDFNFKMKNALRFLEDGDKVKVSVRFRGREMTHTNIGEQQLRKFAEAVSHAAAMEKPPKLEGRNMTMFLTPRPPVPEKPAKPAPAKLPEKE